MNKTIYDLVLESRQGNKQGALAIVEKFSFLLKKHASELKYEDAYADLTLALIVAIHKMPLESLRIRDDPGLIRYFNVVIANESVSLAKKTRLRMQKIILTDEIDSVLPLDNDREQLFDNYDKALFSDLTRYLTPFEAEVIRLIFYNDISVQDIAAERHVSRQSINNTKLRALRKLRKIFSW